MATFPLIPVTHFLNISDKILYNKTRKLRFVSKGAKLRLAQGKTMTSHSVLRAGKSQKAPEVSGRNLWKHDHDSFEPAGSDAGAPWMSV